MRLIESLDEVRRRFDVLTHPFYVRWERGELTREDLALYAGEYRHAVTGLAETAAQAAPLAGPAHAAEEAAHIALWDEFAAAAGADLFRKPMPETRRCVDAWTGARDELAGLAILYAIEAGQPAVSRTKLAGLVEHYGFAPDSPATAYFSVHAERDEHHAREARELLEEHAAESDGERLVSAAEAALAGNWELLDGVSGECSVSEVA